MTDMTKLEDKPLARTATPADLLQMAVAGGADLDKLEKLMALQERWEANEAKKAFVAALVEFKKTPMVIGKNKHVSFRTAKGVTEYDHAELVDCTDVIVPNLAKHGLSHDWNIRQDGPRITVSCTITHELGHSKTVEMSAGPDDSGGKNSIQAVASTNTYLQRYTLLAACGLATGGVDDDGRAGGAEIDGEAEDVTGEAAEPETDPMLARRKAKHDEVAGRLAESIAFIKECITRDDAKAAANEWRALENHEREALWLAPSKGGIFSTSERAYLVNNLPKPPVSQDPNEAAADAAIANGAKNL